MKTPARSRLTGATNLFPGASHQKSGVSLNETHPASKSLSSCVLNVRFQRTYRKQMLSIHMLGLRSHS